MDADIAKFFDDIRIFRCIRLRANLSPACCGRNFSEAATMACVGCDVGKRHAAEHSLDMKRHVTGRTSRWDSRPAGVCVRCNRHTLRLVRSHTVCVSCYNRENEVRRGANAKGALPIKWSGLRPALMSIVEKDGTLRVVALSLCLCRQEAERIAERRWPGCAVRSFHMNEDLPKNVPHFLSAAVHAAF